MARSPNPLPNDRPRNQPQTFWSAAAQLPLLRVNGCRPTVNRALFTRLHGTSSTTVPPYPLFNNTGVPLPNPSVFDALPLFTPISQLPLDPTHPTAQPELPYATCVPLSSHT